MGISRRDFFKVCGGAVAATGLSQFKLDASYGSSDPDVDVYAFICGVLKTKTQYILKDTRVDVPFNVPVPFFIIRHGRDWVALDTGNNGEVAKDPVEYWGEGVVGAYTPVMQPYEEFRVQIKMLGLAPKDLACAAISHGHLDHAGAIDNFVDTNVPILFQKAELDVIQQHVASGKRSAYIPADFSHFKELNVQGISGVYDIFGDRSVVLFPTPGHTQGHQSMLVRTRDGKNVVLCQDACYTLENMMANIPPGLAWDIPQSMEGLYIFKAMSYMGAEIVPPHDPGFWKNKPLAPERFRV